MGTSVRKSECRIDVKLFLDEYPWRELGTPHWSVILHEMFLHATERGQKEVEGMVCQGHWGSTLEPDPEVGQSAMELVGYQTSRKEIQDIYQSVNPLGRPPGLPSCGDQLRRKMIWDILSSLEDQLHRCGYLATAGGDPEPQEGWQSRPNRQESYKEALRAACQRVLDTTKALQVILKGWVKEWGIGHKPTLELTPEPTPKAIVEVVLGVEAGVTAGLVARVALIVVLRVDNQGPPMDLHLVGGWHLENLRWGQTLKEE